MFEWGAKEGGSKGEAAWTMNIEMQIRFFVPSILSRRVHSFFFLVIYFDHLWN